MQRRNTVWEISRKHFDVSSTMLQRMGIGKKCSSRYAVFGVVRTKAGTRKNTKPNTLTNPEAFSWDTPEISDLLRNLYYEFYEFNRLIPSSKKKSQQKVGTSFYRKVSESKNMSGVFMCFVSNYLSILSFARR